ncbi:CDP-diacylglycerol diphosphatase [Acidisphaera sp. S103]|uniref:CDP-diacylglycerol diphosphatase n=1 Tax=Acidisphaera sp. S103 TaxID=1747223 RepID=UPI00131B7644|nr:CDP-diacylglycerol diphosphatase [Acidisphaera sp. S103]
MRLFLALLAGVLLAPAGARADPSALWKIVNGQCVPHEQAERDPAPCTSVNVSEGVDKGFALLKDRDGATQFLLIPTARVSGIEDPKILEQSAPNYWDAAWQARYFVEDRAQTPLARDGIALAINSPYGRTQDQLHIHIDCIDLEVRKALAANLDKIGGVWAPFPVPLAGHSYRAIRIDHETLDGVNPFRILAEGDPTTGGDISKHTLALVGETFADGSNGFVLLDDKADLAAGDRASGEQLEDHACAIAGK